MAESHGTLPDITEALPRLVAVARSNTGQSRRVANFLLAWWDGHEWGHFPITDLFAVDREIARDMAAVIAHLAERGEAVYANAFGYREHMADLVERWRKHAST